MIWSALTAAVNMFETAATSQEFSSKFLKWQADVGGESTKCAMFKMQAVDAINLRVIVGMVKGDAELKLFQSMVKYNDVFVSPNLSVNLIAFMAYCPLEGRLWVLKIPRDKPWVWPEVKFLSNSIQMQTHFSQETNSHCMWDTIGKTNLTTKNLPRLTLVPYASVEWISKGV